MTPFKAGVLAVTTIVNAVLEPLASEATLHVTVVVPVQPDDAETKVVPAGSTSVTVINDAVPGPAFITVIVKVIC